MTYEVIPFTKFMSVGLTPLPIVEGYVFFGSLSLVLIGMVVLEKFFGITINDAMVKVIMFATFLGMIAWFILKNPFMRYLSIGF